MNIVNSVSSLKRGATSISDGIFHCCFYKMFVVHTAKDILQISDELKEIADIPD